MFQGSEEWEVVSPNMQGRFFLVLMDGNKEINNSNTENKRGEAEKHKKSIKLVQNY